MLCIIKSISCLYYLSVSLTIISNPTDRQHKPQELNKHQAVNSEHSYIMIPWCSVSRYRLHLLNYHVWFAEFPCHHDPKLNIKQPIRNTWMELKSTAISERWVNIAQQTHLWWVRTHLDSLMKQSHKNIYFGKAKNLGSVCLVCREPKNTIWRDGRQVYTSVLHVFITWSHSNP